MAEVIDNWGIIASFAAAVWAVWNFFVTRRRELAWKRTEFIIEQLEFLDSDPEMRECTLVLYGKYPGVSIDQFLAAAKTPGQVSLDQGQMIMKFEKYLNFLWRIAYAQIVLGTLTKQDLCAFGAYFRAVGKDQGLRQYCMEEGFDEIVTASIAVERELGRTK